MLDFIVMQMSKVNREKGYCLEKHNVPNFNPFLTTGVIFISIWLIEVVKKLIENTWISTEKLYRNT